MFDEWEKHADGGISVVPLMGYATAVFAQSSIGVKLDFPLEGDSLESPTGKVQLVLTPHQAIELSRALQNGAEKILAIKPKGRPS